MKTRFFSVVFVLFSLALSAQDLTALIDKASPSIFKITTYDASGNEYATGTGFFISAKGEAITNYHVMQGASKAKVKTFDNKTYLVDNVLSWSAESDLLKFTVKNELNEIFPFLKLNVNDPKPGEKIFIMGNPLGLEKSVADGIVSSIRDDEEYGKVIQITAPISHGNSGSPLMSMTGECYGVVTYFLTEGQNLNFAVSIKNMNIMETVNALKFPAEDGMELVSNDITDDYSGLDNNLNTLYYMDSKVTFCEDVDENNYPKNEAESFDIGTNGGYLTVYIDNKEKAIESAGLKVDIYKKSAAGKYDEYVDEETLTIKPELVATWFEYTFYSGGEYVFQVYNEEDTWINDGYVTINMEGESSDSGDDLYNYDDPNSTFYYMDSKIEFCIDVMTSERCDDPGSTFLISKEGSYIYVSVNNGDKKLATDELKVEIYKKKGKNYDDYYDTKYFDIKEYQTVTHFKYTFYNAGDYLFKIYSGKDVWVQDGYVTIEYDK